MRIDNFYFVVEDITKSIKFYSKLFEEEPTNITENRWADWQNRDNRTYFGIISVEATGDKRVIENNGVLGLYTDDIDKIHLENAYPNNYLIDDDYIINADKIFIVFMDNIVVGYASINKHELIPDEGSDFNIEISPNNIKIMQLALKKDYQNKGIGTYLITYIKDYAKINDINYIYLYSMKDNEKGKNFYLKNDFVLSGIWSINEYKGIKDFKSLFYSYKVK